MTVRVRSAWRIAIGAAVLIGIYTAVRADDWSNDPLHAWWARQESVSGTSCCGRGDGHVLSDRDWRASPAGYEVRINGTWLAVPASAARDPKGGPNPTGAAVVWYASGGSAPRDIRIWCFAPGEFY